MSSAGRSKPSVRYTCYNWLVDGLCRKANGQAEGLIQVAVVSRQVTICKNWIRETSVTESGQLVGLRHARTVGGSLKPLEAFHWGSLGLLGAICGRGGPCTSLIVGPRCMLRDCQPESPKWPLIRLSDFSLSMPCRSIHGTPVKNPTGEYFARPTSI